MAKKRATSVDVARAAGVAQSTVSRVLNEDGRISADTRRRVQAAADQLGYKPNAIARSLITQSTNFVGIVMADVTNPFYPNVLEKFTTRFQAMGRQVLLFHVPPDQDVDDILPLAMQYQLEGLIITSATISSEMANACAELGMAVVLFNRYVSDGRVSAVCCDNLAGGRQVADLLLDAGYQRPAYMAGKANTSTNIDREQGFGGRLQEHGIVNYLRVQGAYTYQSGYDAALELLNRDDPPDAVFCANDIMAMGCMDAARYELGIQIPGELAIVGFDDIPASRWPSYALTTARQPVNQMIESTLALLEAHIESPSMATVVRLEPARLIERGSTRSRY